MILSYIFPTKKNSHRPQILEKNHLFFFGAGFCVMKIMIFLMIFFLPFYARQAESDLKEFEYDLVKLVNETRVAQHKKPLIQNAFLNVSAATKNTDMLSRGYFSHQDLNKRSFSRFIDDTGYHYGMVGENLAMGFTTPEKTIEAWKNSPTHFENIIDEHFEETGISVAAGLYHEAPTIFMTQHFAGPTLVSSQEPKPFELNAQKSTVTWEKNGAGMTLNVRARIEGDAKFAAANLGQYEITLEQDKNKRDWTGGIVTAQSPESFFSLITLPTITITSANGIRSIESLEWKNIPRSSAHIDQYFTNGFAKWASIIQKFLFYSNNLYAFFLALFSLALVGNLRRGSCEFHDRMNIQTASMLVMLILLLIIQPLSYV